MLVPDALARASLTARRSLRRGSIIEVAAAVVLVGLVLHRSGPGPLAVVAALTPALAVGDVRSLRLPNALVLPVGAAALAALAGALPDGGGPAVTAVLATLGYAVLRAAHAVGMGDVKLASALVTLLAVDDGATALGPHAVAGLLLPFVSAAGWAVLRSAVGDRSPLPFGPFLLGSFWVVQLTG